MRHWPRNLTGFLQEMLCWQATPSGLAGAIAGGLVLGLVPKANLCAAVVMAMLLVARVNVPACVASIALGSLVSSQLDPVFHAVGKAILTSHLLQPFWAWWFAIPWFAWTGLQNTVVAGSLFVGVLLWYPTRRGLEAYLRRRLGQTASSHGATPPCIPHVGTRAAKSAA